MRDNMVKHRENKLAWLWTNAASRIISWCDRRFNAKSITCHFLVGEQFLSLQRLTHTNDKFCPGATKRVVFIFNSAGDAQNLQVVFIFSSHALCSFRMKKNAHINEPPDASPSTSPEKVASLVSLQRGTPQLRRSLDAESPECPVSEAGRLHSESG